MRDLVDLFQGGSPDDNKYQQICKLEKLSLYSILHSFFFFFFQNIQNGEREKSATAREKEERADMSRYLSRQV